MKGRIFNIQRFSTNDGPGIRTVVFFKGCPLRCAWCHNPESKSADKQIFFDSKKCIGCKACAQICQSKAQVLGHNGHSFVRDNCTLCANCATVCPAGALEVCGKTVTSDEVVWEALRDRDFYASSGGGLTLSGGEPLAQYDFALEIVKKAKQEGISTAVETSGYCRRSLRELSRYVDLWLYDIKLFDEAEHVRFTGVSNKLITQNLLYLDSIGAKLILRCPIIPDVNLFREHFDSVAALAEKLCGVVEVHLEPYHPLGIDKEQRLGLRHMYENRSFLGAQDIEPFAEQMKKKTGKKILIL